MDPSTPSRRSPIRFDAEPTRTEHRDGWLVGLEYPDEGTGPWLVDLSHRARWDFQDQSLDDHTPFGLTVPSEFGGVRIQDGLAINRMNRTQVSIWHMTGPVPPTPSAVSYTETTDGHCAVALLGPNLAAVCETITNLDLFDPSRTKPHLIQGPVQHVACQVVTFEVDFVMLTCVRGYGQTFVHGILSAASPTGLRVAGEDRFTGRVDHLTES